MSDSEVQLDPSEALKLADEIDYLNYEDLKRVQHYVIGYMLAKWEEGGCVYFTALQKGIVHVKAIKREKPQR